MFRRSFGRISRWLSQTTWQRLRLFGLALLIFVVALATVFALPTISFGATVPSHGSASQITRTEKFPPGEGPTLRHQGVLGSNIPTPEGLGDLVPPSPLDSYTVETNPIVYLVFWGSAWSSDATEKARANGAQSFFQDLSNTPYEAILTQYYDKNATHISSTITLGGVDYVSAPAPDSQICGGPTYNTSTVHNEVSQIANAKGWTSLNATVILYLPPYSYEQTCGCGYHDLSDVNSGAVADAIIPFPQAGCFAGSTTQDYLANVSAHEAFEAITDRKVNLSGWVDYDGEEIGDKCQDYPKENVQLHSHQYQVQPMYSNAIHDCSFGYPSPAPTVTPILPPTATPYPTATPRPPTPTSTPSGGHYEGNHDSSSWTGWEAVDWHAYNFVRSTWVVPSIYVRDYSDMNTWIGFNGDSNQVGSSAGYLARAGVDVSVDDVGDVYYDAYWQVRDTGGNILAQNDSFYSGIAPGQKVSFNVWYDGSTLHFDFYDATTGWGNSGTNHTYYAPGWQEYTANWIVSGEGRYLANWNDSGLTLTNCTASPDNANWYGINAKSYYSDTMVNSGGGALANPGSLSSGGTQFSPSWG